MTVINLYSKESTDGLLSAKLSDAPSDGHQYVRLNGAWSILSGGGSSSWGSISGDISTQTDLQNQFANYLLLSGGTLSGPLVSNSQINVGGALITSSGFSIGDGTSTSILQPTGLVFPDATIQVTAATAFNGGTITNGISITGTSVYQTNVGCGYIQLFAGGSGVTVAPEGIYFSNGTFQGSAGFAVGSGDLDLDGYSLTDGNFSSPAGQIAAQNLTLTYGDPGVITFSDGSIQSTAASGGGDLNASVYGAFCVQLTFLASSIPSTSPFQFALYGAMNTGVNYYAMSNLATSGNFGVTQDGANFYPFDSIIQTSPYVLGASSFSLDTSRYLFLAYKDSAGAWHLAPNCIIYSP